VLALDLTTAQSQENLKWMPFKNTGIRKSSAFASINCFRFGDMLFTLRSQNGAQITPAPLKNSYLARPHAGHFFGCAATSQDLEAMAEYLHGLVERFN
jgi:hypothetical protein